MAKSRSKNANNQRSNTKNPNNAAYRADRANRGAQGHAHVPAPPDTETTPQKKSD